MNTHGCRQMTEGLEVLAARARAHSLPTTVVVALGANWTVTSDQIRHALMILGRERVLGLVTPRELGGAVTSDQANMRAAGRRWPRRVKVLDWVRYSSGHDSWFGGDGLHLGPDGARGFARLLERAFDWPIPSLTTTWTAEPRAPAAESLSARIRSARSVLIRTEAATEAPAVERCTPSPWRTRVSRPCTRIDSRKRPPGVKMRARSITRTARG